MNGTTVPLGSFRENKIWYFNNNHFYSLEYKLQIPLHIYYSDINPENFNNQNILLLDSVSR